VCDFADEATLTESDSLSNCDARAHPAELAEGLGLLVRPLRE
jgi:hypothetical protein